MSSKRILIPLVVTLTIVTMMTGYVAQSRKSLKTTGQRANQRGTLEPDKEAAIKAKLAILLADQGLLLTDTPLNRDSNTYRTATVRWEAVEASAAPGAAPVDQHLGHARALAISATRVGSLPRQRSVELSIDQLMVIGVDENSRVLWWHTFADPRLVRSETPGVNGELKNESFYLPRVDFSIAYPDDSGIRTLSLYHPIWNGKNFQLQAVGSLTVANLAALNRQ